MERQCIHLGHILSGPSPCIQRVAGDVYCSAASQIEVRKHARQAYTRLVTVAREGSGDIVTENFKCRRTVGFNTEMPSTSVHCSQWSQRTQLSRSVLPVMKKSPSYLVVIGCVF